MIKVDEWTTIRTLRTKGVSIRKISKLCNVSRNTVRRVLKEDGRSAYKRKPMENHILKDYEQDIKEMVEKKFIGKRIYEELKKKGYTHSYVTICRYLKHHGLSKPSKKVSMRYETSPGKQFQFDWSGYKIIMAGKECKVYCFLVVSGFSRKKAGIFSYTDTQQSVIDALEAAFFTLGGTAKELLIDNATAMVRYHRGKDIIFNDNFLEFCGTYRIEPKPCPPYWPRLKGKVENPFRYINEHFIKGSSFSSLEDLNIRFAEFLKSYNARIHSSTLKPADSLFEEERPLLTELPLNPFFSSSRTFRKVSWDCLISVDGVRYSVPHCYAGKQVVISIYLGEKLKIYNLANELIAIHLISQIKGKTIIDEKHYEGLRPSLPRSAPCIREDFLKTFTKSGKDFYLRLAKEYYNASRWARIILSLKSYYPVDDIEEAMGIALSFGSCKVSTLRYILANKSILGPEIKPNQIASCNELIRTYPVAISPGISRQPGYYSACIAAGGDA